MSDSGPSRRNTVMRLGTGRPGQPADIRVTRRRSVRSSPSPPTPVPERKPHTNGPKQSPLTKGRSISVRGRVHVRHRVHAPQATRGGRGAGHRAGADDGGARPSRRGVRRRGAGRGHKAEPGAGRRALAPAARVQRRRGAPRGGPLRRHAARPARRARTRCLVFLSSERCSGRPSSMLDRSAGARWCVGGSGSRRGPRHRVM